MDIGTADILEELDKPERSRSRLGLSGPNGPSGGGGDRRDPGGPGGSGPDGRDGDAASQRFTPGKARIFTGFLLLVVLMTFGGLMAAYVVISLNKALEWHPFELPIQIWISTVMILGSSISYHLGKMAVDADDQPRAKRWFLVTTVLGAAFISSQLLAWLELTNRGLYMQGNPYAGFFYILTAAHAMHVLGGIIALGSILLRVWHRSEDPDELLRRVTVAQVVGWYWHAIGALWIVLFVLLGFWK